MAGILYIVGTPIGNLEDITLRALRILKEADLIAAEDTRQTRKLLDRYDIPTSVTSYHRHNEKTKAGSLLEILSQGKRVALVSDAGTPTLSDPGCHLVVRAIEASIAVVPVPGPSALAAALSAAGLPTDRFVFEGFLPSKNAERRRRLETLRAETRTLVFYEAPHRVLEVLRDMREILGDRPMAAAREITKLHEEFRRGPISDVLDHFAAAGVKGELTLVVGGSAGAEEFSEADIEAEIVRSRAQGMRVKDLAEMLGEKFGRPKKEIYRLILRLDDAASR